MNLSPKALRLVIEALDHYQQVHDERLARPGLSEDEISDLENDRHYLAAIKEDFERRRDELSPPRQNIQADA
jgi:hypothetical protein